MSIIILAVGILLSIVFTVIGLFLGNIILFDSILMALIAGLVAHGVFHIHPALCLVIGLVVLAGLYFLQKTSVGFWIIGGLMSLMWTLVFATIAKEASGGDTVWTIVVAVLGLGLMIGLHLRARFMEGE